VSSRGQKSDLQNQIALLKTKYPETEVIFDFGSGLNFKRKGLQKILDLAYKGELKEIVVTYKDRLCRFGFELVEYILETQSNAKIVVLNKNNTAVESELATYLLSIINVFSTRMHCLRKYKK
jgi:predicted site-specific integrase-resolvase